MDASALVRDVRKRAGLTQVALAARAGTSQAAVARYESGAASPSVATLERLVRAAGAELTLSTKRAPASNLSGERAAKLRRHRGDIRKLARAAGATNIRVFGSVARGEDDPDSDIDLLVDFDTSGGLRPLVRLKAELEALLGVTVDVAPVSLLKSDIERTALREAVPL